MAGSARVAPLSVLTAAAQESSSVAGALGVDPGAGLSAAEVADRLADVGPNVIPRHETHVWAVLWRQVRSPLLLLLLAAAVVSAFFGESADAAIIGAIVALSVGLGFWNEYRAARAADALHQQIQHTTVVRRAGAAAVVDVAHLVPGDVVRVGLGDVVPADLRLLEVTGLECDESVLTGEGASVVKSTAPVAPGSPLAELSSCALAGTVVSGGRGLGVVVATGLRTQFGGIAEGLGSRDVETAFQKGLREFSLFLVYVGAALTTGIFVVNLVVDKPFLDALLFSLAIAVGITPQLLPAVVSTSLAAGSSRLARVKVLVKRLVCIEDLGDVSLLFTDKTGTLTTGFPDFARGVPAPGTDEARLIEWGLLATENERTPGGALGLNALDEALWRSPSAGSVDVDAWSVVGQLPFDHDRRITSVVVRQGGGRLLLVCKGAPESVMERAVTVPPGLRVELDAEFAAGSRVVAVGTRLLPVGHEPAAPRPEDERDLELAGLLVFVDAPKPGVRGSLARLADLGVDVRVVTGDSPVVALQVCRELGLPSAGAVTGRELAGMSDAQLADAIRSETVFARVSPDDKARIVRSGRTLVGGVAFLGDGVNDALALHSADIGISVDTATDVAKDAADVLLLEKELGVLADGVAEGRRIFANTIKYVMMGTSSNFGNMFSAAGASLFLPFLPMLPSQILLNNLLYDAGQLAIPTDRVDEEQLSKPSHWDLGFIRRFMLVFGPVSSIFDVLTFVVLLTVFHAGAERFQTGWFIESLATQSLVIFVIRTRRVPSFRSRPSRPLVLTTVAVVLAGALLPLTPVAPLLHFTPLPPTLYLAIVALTGVYLAIVEGGKHLFYRSLPTGAAVSRAPAGPRPRAHHVLRRSRWFHERPAGRGAAEGAGPARTLSRPERPGGRRSRSGAAPRPARRPAPPSRP